MCMEYSMRCVCGKREASFTFAENAMPASVISRLYCPSCSGDRPFDPESMIADNGWLIEYDMDVARFSALRLQWFPSDRISPAMLFDEGYATWLGIYPGDHVENARERAELVKLAKADPRGYLEKMRAWAIERMDRLRREGWRKATEETPADVR